MFRGLQAKLVFPAPEPSYTEHCPLRECTVDGFYSILEPGERTYQDFRARLFWAGETPCVAFPHRRSDKVIVYAHANRDDIWRVHGLLECLRDNLGVHAVAFEYPSYGVAPGAPSEQSLVGALESVFDFLKSGCGFEEADIMLFGRSIGSGVVTQFAAKHTVGAVVLLSAFSSIKEVASFGAGHKMLGMFAKTFTQDMFRSIIAIQRCECPCLILHGEDDNIVPATHGQALYDACGARFKKIRIFAGMHHNNVFEDQLREQVLQELQTFLQPVLCRASSSPVYFFNTVWQLDITNPPAHSSEHSATAALMRMDHGARIVLVNTIDEQIQSMQSEAELEQLYSPDKGAGAEAEGVLGGLEKSTMDSLERLFSLLDVDKNTRLACAELMLLCTVLHGYEVLEMQAQRRTQVQAAMRAVDSTGAGDINFVEFVELLCTRALFADVLCIKDQELKDWILLRVSEGHVDECR